MRVFWFVYSMFMIAPTALAVYIFYSIYRYGDATFLVNELHTLPRTAEVVCAFLFAVLAVTGLVIASIQLVGRKNNAS